MPLNETRSTERNAVIARAAGVLFAFSAAKSELTLGEIAKCAGLPPSTVRRLLVQLIDAGLIDQDGLSRTYSLSLRLAQLGAVALGSRDTVQLANPVMRALTSRVGEAVFLGQLSPQGVVYLAVTQPDSDVRISTRAGEVRPAHTTSMGKALLAALDPQELEVWLSTHALEPGTQFAHTDPEALKADLEGVRSRGYAVNNRESSAEFTSVAAPVRDHRGATVAALAISAPAYRIPQERVPELGRAVLEAAGELTRRLGGTVVGVA
ncbi:IclR family transcriptional regulator [Sinomonas sp. ASV486]|uniref:IclR family transcriptional regulator n=1 Tax=Sinomonas sp. ASV486 TaxID=3051170 RepID=UPI0027DD735A|nr:IclR family transcriptional regulator [Sinomonas sp. ASV486]MDQ4489786.1 IclR family transcriptional regulator [Sinomonas sp. ASV486]